MNELKDVKDVKKEIERLLSQSSYGIEDLCDIVVILRSEIGCPWDREQTHKSIRNDFIEETYEVIEAIDTENRELLREELGDVLLQVVFHARIEEEKGEFTIDDVANDICKKLIHRHPHVFGDISVSGTGEVLSNWEKIKSDEKSRKTYTDKLRSIPPMLPALMRATKIGKKAKMFDFPDTESVISKLDEEIAELKEAVLEKSNEDMFEEMGDVLLTLTSLSRKLGIDPEQALNASANKFIDRFERLENAVTESGRDMVEMNIEELDKIYEEQKKNK